MKVCMLGSMYKVMELVGGRLEWRFNKKGYETYQKAEDRLFEYGPDGKFGQYVIVYFKDEENRRQYSDRKTYIVGLYFLIDGVWQCIFNQNRLLGPISDKIELTDKIFEDKQERLTLECMTTD